MSIKVAEETITINGEKYIRKDNLTQSQYMIPEKCNVLAIIPLKNQIDIDEIIEIEGLSKFKKFTDEISFVVNENFKPEKFKLRNSCYSMEFFEIAKKTAKAFGYGTKPELFMWLEDEEYSDDKPCLIKFEGLCFLLAPRVENE